MTHVILCVDSSCVTSTHAGKIYALLTRCELRCFDLIEIVSYNAVTIYTSEILFLHIKTPP